MISKVSAGIWECKMEEDAGSAFLLGVLGRRGKQQVVSAEQEDAAKGRGRRLS